MTYTWKQWLVGLLNAAVSGAIAGAAVVGFGGSGVMSLKVAGVSALGSAAKWYLQHPPPGTPKAD